MHPLFRIHAAIALKHFYIKILTHPNTEETTQNKIKNRKRVY